MALKDRNGGVAVVWALAALPLIALLAMVVEYGSALRVRRSLQESLDGALLALSQERLPNSAAEYAFVTGAMAANFASPQILDTLQLSLSKGEGGMIAGTARVKSDLLFPKLFGRDVLDIAANTEIKREAYALDAMLVLDVTGSMAGQKLATLKTAAKSFVKTVLDGDNVRVGLVPFAQYVNIGTDNRDLEGFDIPADYETCGERNVGTTVCTGRVASTCYNDGKPYACERSTGCTTTYEVKNVCTKFKWSGCVGSREAPLNQQDSNPSTPIPGLLNVPCNASALVRLTSVESDLTTAIEKLSASGKTYIPSGLMMGWHAITPRNPLPDGAPYDADTQPLRAIVLMTDGENTASKKAGSAAHAESSKADANAVTKKLCENARADNVIVYAIAFEVDDADTLELLDKCDSSGAAIDAKNSAELLDAFETIVGRLSRLRLSR